MPVDSPLTPSADGATDDLAFLAVPSKMAALIRDQDWAATPLGPIANWPQSLRTTVSLCLASNFPINIIWGPDAIQIYNDGYRVVCGDKHPAALGMDYRQCWESAWPAIGAPFESARLGATSFLENQRMFLFRNGYLEETFFTFSLSPIRDESGGIGGLFHPVTETTATMVGERRTRAVRDLTAQLAGAQSRTEVYQSTIATVADYVLDLPFVLLYELDAASGAYRRVGHTGVGLPSALAPDVLDDTFWPAAQLRAGARLLEIAGLARVAGVAPCGPYDEAPDSGFALSVQHAGSPMPVALLLTAASARLPLDDVYRGFFELVGAAYGAALARVMRLEEERERLAMLAALDRAKIQFFSNVSHEFRTPLTLLQGPLDEVLDEPALPAQARELLTIAQRNAARLLKLVNGLLDFSRLEDGRDSVRFVPTDLAAFTAELASNFRAACERAGLALHIDCRALDAPAWIDRDSWEKIVLNLMSNAFKFTLHGGIEVRLRQDGNHAELTVADTGVGIPGADVARVFERFHRIEGQAGRSVEGTGIGLALVKEMVGQHGGAIDVDSVKGQGTRFRVRLPLGAAHLPQDQLAPAQEQAPPSARAAVVVDEALRWTVTPQAGASDSAAGAMRVLLADDNADMRAYVRRILQDAGYAVQEAANGAAALDTIQRGPLPDLLLSDVMMPQLDGFGLLDAVRRDPVASELVVILLSARAGQEARVEGLSAGADDYLVKPFSARELVARVDGAVRLARLRKDAAAREHALRLVIATRDTRDALQRSEAEVTSLFEQAATGVLQAGLDGRLRRVNTRLASMLGLPLDSCAGRALTELADPDDRPALTALLAAMRAGGQPGQADVRLLRAGAAPLWTTVAFTPLLDADTLLGVVLDISDRVDAEDRLRSADRSKDEFLAMLAHELRNPLAPISAAAELMSRVQLDGTQIRRTSAVIARQVRHMTALVDDLLDVSRVTRGLVLVDQAPLDMHTVIADAVEQVHPLIDAQRQELVLQLGTGPATVLGDHKRLVQVMGNLLNNAAKYTPAGGRIEVVMAVRDGAVTVSVSDNGMGIALELQTRIFDLFAQAARTPDRSQGGLGLGLALAKRLLALHHGSIACESAGPGSGSRFVVTLPHAPQSGEDGGAGDDAAVTPDALRVLVVDDNVDAAAMVAMLLDAFGYRTMVEHGSRAALARAQAERPDVCILDIGLPDMDGNELARRLRADTRTSTAMLIALTGYSRPEDRAAALAAGFDYHFAKPADVDKLAEVLSAVAARAAPALAQDERSEK